MNGAAVKVHFQQLVSPSSPSPAALMMAPLRGVCLAPPPKMPKCLRCGKIIPSTEWITGFCPDCLKLDSAKNKVKAKVYPCGCKFTVLEAGARFECCKDHIPKELVEHLQFHYYCPRCRREHDRRTKVGQEHVVYSESSVI